MKNNKKNNGRAVFFVMLIISFFVVSAIACTPPNLNAGGGGAETDLSDYYTKEEVDGLIAGVIAELGAFYTREEVNDLIEELSGNDINLNDYYTKTEVDDLLAGSSTDLSAYYTKAEVDSLFDSNAYGYIASSSSSTQFQFGDQTDWVDIPGISATFNLASGKMVKITAFGSVHMSMLRDCWRSAVSFRYVIDGNAYYGVYASIMGDTISPEYYVKLYSDVPWAMTRIQYLNAGSHSVKVQVKPSNPGEPTQAMLRSGSRYLYVETINSVTD